MKQSKEALHYYKNALTINPHRYDSNFSVAAIEQAQGEIEEALTHLMAASKLSINSGALWNNLGAIMQKKGKNVVAYCCLQRALFLDPFRWDIHTNIGLLLMKEKKYLFFYSDMWVLKCISEAHSKLNRLL